MLDLHVNGEAAYARLESACDLTPSMYRYLHAAALMQSPFLIATASPLPTWLPQMCFSTQSFSSASYRSLI